MFRLHFSSIMAAPVTVGPLDALLLVGSALIEHPSGRHVARLIDHQWRVADRCYLRFDCDGAVPWELRFVGPASPTERAFGPYRHSHVADGVIYAEGTPIARYLDDADRWACLLDGGEWPVVSLDPGGAGRVA